MINSRIPLGFWNYFSISEYFPTSKKFFIYKFLTKFSKKQIPKNCFIFEQKIFRKTKITYHQDVYHSISPLCQRSFQLSIHLIDIWIGSRNVRNGRNERFERREAQHKVSVSRDFRLVSAVFIEKIFEKKTFRQERTAQHCTVRKVQIWHFCSVWNCFFWF